MKRFAISLACILPVLAACSPQQQDAATLCAASLIAVPVPNGAADLLIAAQQSPACIAAGLDLMQQGVALVMKRRGIK